MSRRPSSRRARALRHVPVHVPLQSAALPVAVEALESRRLFNATVNLYASSNGSEDGPGNAVFVLEVTNNGVACGAGALADIHITLSVNDQFQDAATINADYYMGLNVTIPAGYIAVEVDAEVVDDTEVENVEDISVIASSTECGFANSQADAYIWDNDIGGGGPNMMQGGGIWASKAAKLPTVIGAASATRKGPTSTATSTATATAPSAASETVTAAADSLKQTDALASGGTSAGA